MPLQSSASPASPAPLKPPTPPQPVRLAAIDIGTVTCRLLVADVSDAGIREVDRSVDITHLGEGLAASSALSAAAMQRVADVIRRYAARMEELCVEGFSAIATSASRDASNSAGFLEMLASCGVSVEVISGLREAELSFAGAVTGRVGEGLLVVDCGGGSTELIFGDALPAAPAHVRASKSIDIGSRRMTERHLHSDPPTAAELAAAHEEAVALLHPFFGRLEGQPSQLIGVAGTATTLAAIKLGLAEYDPEKVHGQVLTAREVSAVFKRLAELSLKERRELAGLHPERAGVIVAGALIVKAALELSGLDQITVSENDVLYGILLDIYRHL